MARGYVTAAALLLAAAARAEEPGPGDLQPIEDLDLTTLLNAPVVSSTKSKLRAAQTPAVVTVVTADDIRMRGLRTLAEILRAVPGFYDVDDLVSHNVGVRGINGGARAGGSVVKVMIDGQPVDSRPTTGNVFGEELIPVEAIERVEIIRGPVSALYGANAFLGVVNVITREGARIGGVRGSLTGVLVGAKPGFGGTLVAGGAGNGFDALVGVGAMRIDRSGLTLPSTSPVQIPGESQNDLARPSTLFAKASKTGVLGGKLSFLGSERNTDAGAEFQDFAALTHDTRIARTDRTARLQWEASPTDTLDLRVAAQAFSVRPGENERLDIGRADALLVRRLGVDGGGLAAEAHWRANERIELTGGVDWVHEKHLLQAFDELLLADVKDEAGVVVRAQGTVVPGGIPGAARALDDVGAFVQGVLAASDAWGATVGARVDRDVLYGLNLSARAALVHAPPDAPVTWKVLYGSSFKAPSMVQLTSQPMKVGDLLGNPALRAQTAHTVEVVGGFVLPRGLGEVTVNVFGTMLLRRVEFVRRGLYLEARNRDTDQFLGGELDSRIVLAERLQLRVSAGIARPIGEASSVLVGVPDVREPLFPPRQIHAQLGWTVPVKDFRLLVAPELSVVGLRAASQSNSLLAGTPYEMPPYLHVGTALTLEGWRPFGRETTLSLRAIGRFTTRLAEPGFGGIDVPMPVSIATLTWSQEL